MSLLTIAYYIMLSALSALVVTISILHYVLCYCSILHYVLYSVILYCMCCNVLYCAVLYSALATIICPPHCFYASRCELRLSNGIVGTSQY